jgi:hypothetical protein
MDTTWLVIVLAWIGLSVLCGPIIGAFLKAGGSSSDGSDSPE